MSIANMIEGLNEVARDLWNAGKLNSQARMLERIAEALATQPAEQASAGSIGDDEKFMLLLSDFACDFAANFQSDAEKSRAEIIAYIDSRPRLAAPLAPSDTQGAEREAVGTSAAAFKNFHRALCARFGYVHDEKFWWRDLASLEEYIAAIKSPTPTPEAIGAIDGKQLIECVTASTAEMRVVVQHYDFQEAETIRYVDPEKLIAAMREIAPDKAA